MEEPRKIINYKNGCVVKFENKRFSVMDDGETFTIQFARLISEDTRKYIESLGLDNDVRWIARGKILVHEITISKNVAEYLAYTLMFTINSLKKNE